ncbi:uncharacterized protein FMAN_16033 [Fusarium mangiferae]|uniref:PNPLA domain-containing protein n=1 Tax=Fusarium mangiferae TaxID=192010 RepID=A0A1L7SRJ7_FUSMA|nr:uncharacterized protein FMAN_16033 [Fusarium mangiferae]CVK85067.1 uncharacterized protein FMAN_16033 [Fusarium mangiferae]
MDPTEVSRLRFCRFIRSFQCETVPCDLFVRACGPKSTWSSSGEVVQRLPSEAGVPEWLIDFYNTNKHLFHDADHGAHIEGLEIMIENGVPYFEVATASEPETEFCQLSSIADERSMAQARIDVFLQAFPSINIEIIGEEIVERLMDVAKGSILPLLSCVTDADIKDWLFTKNHCDLESYTFSFFEFLYQVIGILGVEHPLLPLSLPERILNTVPHDPENDRIVNLCKVADMVKHFKDNGPVLLDYKPLSPGTKTDQRSHATLGYFLSLQNIYFAEALKTWQPLLSKSPSQMEYLAAISFCDQSRLALSAERPAFLTLDTRVLEGLLRSRRKQHDQAAKALEVTRVEVVSQYGLCSMQVGIVTAELANCYNILRREELAELALSRCLELRLDADLSNRCDGIYIRLALADSLIGQAKYHEAVPVLESVMGNPNISATFRMMSVLRLTKSRRRMHDDAQKAFEQNSPLWTGFALLSNVSEILVMEYVEELGCSISELPRRQLGPSKNAKRLMEAVNSALYRLSSLTESPCWKWYRNVQKEYLAQVEQDTKVTKGKGKDEGLQSEYENELRTPLPRPFPTFLLRQMTKRPMTRGLVGTGSRAISGLFILKHIMHKIRELEFCHEDGIAYSSSSSSYTRHEYGMPRILEDSARVDKFLPCHYFDYMAGTSTASLNSIMLGRLRMSVDQAIDNFIDFSNDVLGQPLSFNTILPVRQFSSTKALEAFQKILMKSNLFANEDVSELRHAAKNETFRENGGRRTRTMTVSYNMSTGREHIWTSYDAPHRKISGGYSATIREVALATSATPLYFRPIKIDVNTHWDGRLAKNHTSYLALVEIARVHRKYPAVSVDLSSGPAMKPEARRKLEILAKTLTWTHFPPTPLKQRVSDIGKFLQYSRTESSPESEPNQFRELAESMGLEKAYTLSTEEVLPKPYPTSLRPASEVKESLQQIKFITENYLRKDEIRDVINRIAGEAVRIRRARAHANEEQWENFVK